VFLIQKHRIPKCITNLHPRFFVKLPRLKYNILKLSFFYLYEVFNQQLKNKLHSLKNPLATSYLKKYAGVLKCE
jgi:hypothetical protein